MSTAEMDRLVSEYSTNESLRSQLDSATDLANAAEIAHAAGYDVSIEEAQAYIANLQSGAKAELSDAQLDAVSGGKNMGPGNIVHIMQQNAGSGASVTNFMSAGF